MNYEVLVNSNIFTMCYKFFTISNKCFGLKTAQKGDKLEERHAVGPRFKFWI